MESGALNGVVGDSFGTDLPETVVPKTELIDEKKMARFSKTKEFQRLKLHLDERIAFYQTHLPDGRELALSGLSMDELGRQWIAANTIVGELKGILQAYDYANEVVSDVR